MPFKELVLIILYLTLCIESSANNEYVLEVTNLSQQLNEKKTELSNIKKKTALINTLKPSIYRTLSPLQKSIISSNITHSLENSQTLFNYEILFSIIFSDTEPSQSSVLPVFTIPTLKSVSIDIQNQISILEQSIETKLEKQNPKFTRTLVNSLLEKEDLSNPLLPQLIKTLDKESLFQLLKQNTEEQTSLTTKNETELNSVSKELTDTNSTYILDIIDIWSGLNKLTFNYIDKDSGIYFTEGTYHSVIEEYYSQLISINKELYFPIEVNLLPDLNSNSAITNIEGLFSFHHGTGNHLTATFYSNPSQIKYIRLEHIKPQYLLEEPYPHPTFNQLLSNDFINKFNLDEFINLHYANIKEAIYDTSSVPSAYTVLTDNTILIENPLLKIQFANALSRSNKEKAKLIYRIYQYRNASTTYNTSEPLYDMTMSFNRVNIKFNTIDDLKTSQFNNPFSKNDTLINSVKVQLPSYKDINNYREILPSLGILFQYYTNLKLIASSNLNKIKTPYSSVQDTLNNISYSQFNKFMESRTSSKALPESLQKNLLDYLYSNKELETHTNLRLLYAHTLDSKLTNTPEDIPYIVCLYNNFSTGLQNSSILYIHYINSLTPEQKSELF